MPSEGPKCRGKSECGRFAAPRSPDSASGNAPLLMSDGGVGRWKAAPVRVGFNCLDILGDAIPVSEWLTNSAQSIANQTGFRQPPDPGGSFPAHSDA